MRWTSRSAARVDVRLAAFVGGLVALLNAALVAGFAAFAIAEGFEEEARWLSRSADELGAQLTAGREPRADATPRAVTWRFPDDTPPADAGIRWDADAPGAAFRAGADDFLVRQSRVGSRRFEAALPLAHFAIERAELVRAAALVIAVGTLASLGFGAFAARRALAPVRSIETAVRAVAPGHLAARVPERGTADDVDALAASINAVLARLEWSFQRVEGFSADVAHELRTPIQRVLVESQLALVDAQPERLAAALSSIHETAEQMTALVNQLLLLASGEEGRLRLVRERVDLGAALAKLVEFYAPVAEGLGKRIDLECVTATVACDRGLIERALANLIENALVHGERSARIRIVTVADPEGARVGVLDSGPGLSEADRERIFERFVRLDDSRHGRGSGLGLPIARMIARLHGGDVWAESAPLGGAAFWMRLG